MEEVQFIRDKLKGLKETYLPDLKNLMGILRTKPKSAAVTEMTKRIFFIVSATPESMTIETLHQIEKDLIRYVEYYTILVQQQQQLRIKASAFPTGQKQQPIESKKRQRALNPVENRHPRQRCTNAQGTEATAARSKLAEKKRDRSSQIASTSMTSLKSPAPRRRSENVLHRSPAPRRRSQQILAPRRLRFDPLKLCLTYSPPPASPLPVSAPATSAPTLPVSAQTIAATSASTLPVSPRTIAATSASILPVSPPTIAATSASTLPVSPRTIDASSASTLPVSPRTIDASSASTLPVSPPTIAATSASTLPVSPRTIASTLPVSPRTIAATSASTLPVSPRTIAASSASTLPVSPRTIDASSGSTSRSQVRDPAAAHDPDPLDLALERLIKIVSSKAFAASVREMQAVVSLTDLVSAPAPGGGGDGGGAPVAALTNASTRKLRLDLIPADECCDVDRKCSVAWRWNQQNLEISYVLEQEILETNNILIDTVVEISEDETMKAASEGKQELILALDFVEMELPGSDQHKVVLPPLKTLVPPTYPKDPPLVMADSSSESSDDRISVAARDAFADAWKMIRPPLTIKALAETWDKCARNAVAKQMIQGNDDWLVTWKD